MIAGASILVVRRDGSPKVVLSATGRIVKQISSAPCGGMLAREPRSLRFVRHIERLRAMGETVPRVERLYALAGTSLHVLVYVPVAGTSLRETVQGATPSPPLLRRFARTCARLHDGGAIFRAGHLDNYIVTEDGTLALIDVHGFGFTFGSLSVFRRARSFRIVLKHEVDRAFVASSGGVRAFLDLYVRESSLGALRGGALRLLVWMMHPAAREAW